MAKSSLATKSDIVSLFQELEDASRQAKVEEKKNKIKTESQVVELDSFLSSVQEVVKVTQNENTPINTPIEPIQEITESKSEDREDREDRKDETPTELVETSDTETKALSEEDEDKLNAFSGLMESFGAILDEPPEVEDEDALKLQVQDIYPPSKPKIDENSKIEALEKLFSKLSGINPQPKSEDFTHYPGMVDPKKDKSDGWITGDPTLPIVFDGSDTKSILDKANKEIEKERGVKQKPFVEEIPTPIIVSETPPDMKEAFSRVKGKNPLPTKQETIEATQQLINNVVDNLDDMKTKTEVKEQIDEIVALRKEFNILQQQVRQSQMSGSGSGEVRLEFLDDVQRSTAKVDGKFLKYSSSAGKFIGSESSAEIKFGFLLNGTDGSSTNAGDYIVLNTEADENDNLLYEDGTADPIAVLASHGITLSGQGWNAFQFDNG